MSDWIHASCQSEPSPQYPLQVVIKPLLDMSKDGAVTTLEAAYPEFERRATYLTSAFGEEAKYIS